MSWYANKSELRSLTLVSAVSSVLSIIGASYIIGRYWTCWAPLDARGACCQRKHLTSKQENQ
uniref:Uncharacterized protein n=1 Tax=Hyaloperonospora arabidopsidis (strain Emoy2) TaxID=559515 RepID=M4BXB3_HYAAE